MKLLVDANILLDVALKRPPFYEASSHFVDCLQERKHEGFVAWHSVSNIYYIFSSDNDDATVRNFISDFLEFLKIPETGSMDMRLALRQKMKDFEDAMQVAAALKCHADYIVTRNIKDFRNSPLPATKPETLI